MPVPDFVLRLREHIGHDPLWLIGVTAVVVRQDRVLLVRRSDTGAWTPVTGIVDPGEHPAVAAVREVEEEAAVRCDVVGLAAVGVSPEVVHVNGDRAQYLDHTFLCRHLDGEPRPADDESTAADWFPLGDLPEMPQRMRDRIRTAVEYDGAARLIDDRPV
ncbi:NUDIX domain-containing protein [Zhihengliuella sp.]|uniref:NUDIX hydrolase n=1 Tax=Zhihengliuella sp. TaxID=1954483 RepID=UPI002811891B|nr:NUDIX domain-containing protein [Zhihengliuella sp.]